VFTGSSKIASQLSMGLVSSQLAIMGDSPMAQHRAIDMRLLTHNIRYATSSPVKGEERWPVRAPRMINELRFNLAHSAPGFICLQEVLHGQLTDIMAGLNANSKEPPEWEYIGVGRDDGKTAGEYSPIIYRPSQWKLVENRTVWLSKTPEKPSKGWDAANIRILNVGVFRHREANRELIAMNTHMDHVGKTARKEGALLILRVIGDLQKKGKRPVFLAGDFNSEPTEEAYKVFASPESPIQDLRDAVSDSAMYGEGHTFTGFGHDKPSRIDFLFLSRGDWKVLNYGVLSNKFEDGIYNSDHRAVVGDVRLL
jgi:endonuclease/exonuclease/phosphatase family metal-dependent hydrolase